MMCFGLFYVFLLPSLLVVNLPWIMISLKQRQILLTLFDGRKQSTRVGCRCVLFADETRVVALKLDACDAAALIKGCMLGGQGLTVHIKFSVLLPTTSGMDPNNSFNNNIR